jgi:hypothetical protein
MFKNHYVFSKECTVLCFNHIKVKQHLQDDQCTVFRDNNESITQERSESFINVHPLKQNNCPLVLVAHIWLGQPCQDNRRGEENHSSVSPWGLLLSSDWDNHAKTTDVENRSVIWQQQSSRLDDKSISWRLSALIAYNSNQKHRTSSF